MLSSKRCNCSQKLVSESAPRETHTKSHFSFFLGNCTVEFCSVRPGANLHFLQSVANGHLILRATKGQDPNLLTSPVDGTGHSHYQDTQAGMRSTALGKKGIETKTWNLEEETFMIRMICRV